MDRKRVVTLGASLVISATSVLSFVGAAMAEAQPKDLFVAVKATSPLQIGGAKGNVGEKFTAEDYFTAIDVNCPSWANDIGNLTFTLFKWAGGYAESVAGEPIASETYEDFKDNGWLLMAFPEQKPGEYLWVLNKPTETVGVWKYAASTIGGAFYNGKASKGDYLSRIYFSE